METATAPPQTYTFFSGLAEFYRTFFSFADPRVEHLFLMKSPVPIVLICLGYIYFVLSLGPRLMVDRKPFNLRSVLIVYNAAQSIFSVVLFYCASKHWYENYGLFECIPVNPKAVSPTDIYEIHLCYFYFLSKITELLDTIFFVLKKKDSHVSLLHVFHHAIMPFSVWTGVKFNPGGNLAFFGLPNLFVHIWMYLYYMLAAMGPQYQKYIWWKRHITQLQLGQFAVVFLYILYIANFCSQNRSFVVWIIALDVIFVLLFVDFYRKAYRKKKNVASKENNEKKEILNNAEKVKADNATSTSNGKTLEAKVEEISKKIL